MLTMVDVFIRFTVALSIQTIVAVTVVQSVVDHWIWFFEYPAMILTDLRMQFEYIPFNEITGLLGI